jgi:hypothetical protein
MAMMRVAQIVTPTLLVLVILVNARAIIMILVAQDNAIPILHVIVIRVYVLVMVMMQDARKNAIHTNLVHVTLYVTKTVLLIMDK